LQCQTISIVSVVISGNSNHATRNQSNQLLLASEETSVGSTLNFQCK
jgi:hypothetical protein